MKTNKKSGRPGGSYKSNVEVVSGIATKPKIWIPVKKARSKKKKKARFFCRLYKYVCHSCGKNRHMRHSIEPYQICPKCESIKVNEDQLKLFN